MVAANPVMQIAKQSDTCLVIHRYPNVPRVVGMTVLAIGLVMSLASLAPWPLLLAGVGLALPLGLGHYSWLTLDQPTNQLTLRQGQLWALQTRVYPLHTVVQVKRRASGTQSAGGYTSTRRFQVVLRLRSGETLAVNPVYSNEPGQRAVVAAIRQFLNRLPVDPQPTQAPQTTGPAQDTAAFLAQFESFDENADGAAATWDVRLADLPDDDWLFGVDNTDDTPS